MTEDRLTPQQIEGRLVSALAAIEAAWDDMLVVPPSARPGARTTGTGATLDDHADADDDTPRTVRVIDARAQVVAVLNAWCRVVVEDHNVTHGIPCGTDAIGMAHFLHRWTYLMAEHEAATEMLEEIQKARAVVEKWSPPQQERPPDWAPRPRTIRLGSCPLTWQDPETADDLPCPGTLHGADDGWIRCSACGTLAVASWWEEQTFGEQGAPMMTADQLVSWLHRQYGMVVQPATVRQWVKRGDLVRSGTDEAGRSLYDRWAVESCLQRRQRRSA